MTPAPPQSLILPPPDVTLPRIVRRLRTLATAVSLIPIVAGGLALFGWDAIRMNPATAVAFILTGVALALVSRGVKHAGEAIGVLVMLIGLARLLAVTTGFGLSGTSMTPNTAVNFVLQGLALATIDWKIRRIHWPAQYPAVIAAMISILALLHYAYGVRSFYGAGPYIPMALPTAVLFVIVAVGILCSRPDRGIMLVISSDTAGGALMRRLLPAVILVPILLGWMHLLGERARLFSNELGLWLLVVVLMTVLVVLVGWNGKLLFRFDVNRLMGEAMLAYHASHDALTGLPNRLLFSQELEQALARAQADGKSAAVLFVDLDRFKVINDSLGHPVGDQLLIAAGRRIAERLAAGQIVARIGGDEYTVLLPVVASVNEAIDAAMAVEAAFEQSFTLGPHEVFTTVSIGIALSDAADTPQNVIRHADLAMYQAKARGRARHEIFDSALDQAAMQRLELENDLRRALARGELRVYYQAEVEFESGRLAGMEALIRWEHPERGIVNPTQFIPVAEESGLILPITRWVLFEACRQLKAWEEEFARDVPLTVSVNLSGRHFAQATLIDEVAAVLQGTGIDPSHLILEITESVAMEGAQTTIETLRKLKALGVSLAIDDFGTGFSSLSYLKQFPVDYLKIDKSFVDGVTFQGRDTAIVRAVIALGHALGLKLIAEGVETPEQVRELRELGSEIGQGYYFAKPLTGEGMPALLAAGSAKRS